ncbi:Nucleoside ABC transporter ATP-binding protein OS=Ureibacillus acetophenoni OX=614649 GN=SAMN05877842_104209 PE=4 SV=1 [Ureibacillus acetophenoni]
MEEPCLLEITNLHKQFNQNRVLLGINFRLKKGEIFSMVGGNGAGKSTLMKIIMGLYQPDDGEIKIENQPVKFHSTSDAHKRGIYLVPQEPMIFPNMTIEENIIIGMKGSTKELKEKVKNIMQVVGWNLNLQQLGSHLSIAEQQLVEILRGLVRDVKILILDEPTSTLTNNEIKSLFKVIKQLANDGIGIIYITHRFSEIFELSHSVAVLRDGRISDQGNIKEFTYDRLLAGLKPSKMNDTSLSVIEKEHFSTDDSDYNLNDNDGSNTVLTVEKLSGTKFNEISFHLKRGEVLGIAGVVGAGRTEMAEAIFGIRQFTTGVITLDGEKLLKSSIKNSIRMGMVYLPEDRHAHGIFKITSIRNNITSTLLKRLNGMFLPSKEEYNISRKYINELQVKTIGPLQELKDLSGGNQQKVVLAKFLALNPKVIILDEPTRGIDASARVDIYRIINELKEKGVGIILISSDTEEVAELSDRVVVMREGKIVNEIKKDEITVDNIISAAFGVKGG